MVSVNLQPSRKAVQQKMKKNRQKNVPVQISLGPLMEISMADILSLGGDISSVSSNGLCIPVEVQRGEFKADVIAIPFISFVVPIGEEDPILIAEALAKASTQKTKEVTMLWICTAQQRSSSQYMACLNTLQRHQSSVVFDKVSSAYPGLLREFFSNLQEDSQEDSQEEIETSQEEIKLEIKLQCV